MTLKINSLLGVSLIGALAVMTIPAMPTLAAAAETPEYCGSPTFNGYIRTADIGTDCAGSPTYFFGNCEVDAHFVLVTTEHRNGVTIVDCQVP